MSADLESRIVLEDDGRVHLLRTQEPTWSLMDYLMKILKIAMNKHRFNLLLSAYFWVCIHWLIISPVEDYNSLNIWHTIIIIYIIYLYESFWMDDTSKFITSHIMTLIEFEAYMDALIDSSILLKFSGVHVYGTSALDRTKDKTENTYSYKNWTDKTKRLEVTQHLMKVTCKKEWISWSDPDGLYHTQREEFIRIHELAYGSHSNSYGEKIVFKHALFYPNIIVCSTRAHLPHLLRVKTIRCFVYYLSLFCGVSWFFRVWLDSITKNADFRINKAIRFE